MAGCLLPSPGQCPFLQALLGARTEQKHGFHRMESLGLWHVNSACFFFCSCFPLHVHFAVFFLVTMTRTYSWARVLKGNGVFSGLGLVDRKG